MEESITRVTEKNIVVRDWSWRTQKAKGDSLKEGYTSDIPERVTLNVRQDDLEDLIGIWKQWDSDTRGIFTEKYGDIAHLCFTFNQEDMTPTIEEYVALLRIDNAVMQIVQLSDEAETLSWQFPLSQRSSMSEFLGRVKKQGDVAREFVTHLRARDMDTKLNESDTIEDVSMIHPCPPGYVLNNWIAVELIVVFKSSPE
ncbi:hypothetical protein GOBAR_DD12567 [Gossypium barbadense]|nr:hypothetical protein GOBAR_DD12567 [Gossypium barbadense]